MGKVICFTISLGSGGAERQLVSLAAMLKESGNDVKFLTYLPDSFYEDKLNEVGISHICISHAKSNWTRFWSCKKIIKSFSADVVIAYLEMPAFMGCLMKWMGGTFKLIVSERNTTQKKTRFDKLRFPLMRYADWIVPNSLSQGLFIKKEYPKFAPKVKVITNYVDTNSFIPKKKTHDDTTIVLTVARINPQKNILRYIEAVSKIHGEYDNVVFKWYGAISDYDYYKRCLERINDLGIGDVFFFRQPTISIIDTYQNASIFCLPSLYEGYPNVVCEAMSCGIPIICSNVCDNSTIVENGINGVLVNPTSVDSIKQALKDMLEMDAITLRNMGYKSREFALKKFSKEQFLAQYLSLIN